MSTNRAFVLDLAALLVQKVAMYIERVPNRGSQPTVLLREGWREGKRVRKRTIVNLTHWPPEKVESLRRVLKGQQLVPAAEVFSIEQSRPHGHVEAILGTIRHLELDRLVAAKPSRERSLVLAMLVSQLIHPASKLGTTRLWNTTTLAQELGVEDADESELYAAMDWLAKRQSRIEKKLAKRHLSEGTQVLYDVSSSYYEGRTCVLARRGYGRDKKKGKSIIVYGTMTDIQGRPIALEVYPGNTGDPSTVSHQVDKLRKRFQLKRVVLVGDRGMLTQTQIENLQDYPGLGWISALRFSAIRKLADEGSLQLSLFDKSNLAEISSSEFPNERLIVCKNPLLEQERKRKRLALLEATELGLEKLIKEVQRRTKKPLSAVEIAKKATRVTQRYKMAKHFNLTIEDSLFRYERNLHSIRRESEVDGIYIIRTSEAKDNLSASDAVRRYKNLAQVEQFFRTIKGIDRMVRPIRHRDEQRVRAHIFLCMLAYYVSWHMRKALAPLLFVDEELDEIRLTRDPVAKAAPSASAKRKKATRRNEAGNWPLQSFETLVANLGTRCRNRCRLANEPSSPAFYQLTEPNPFQTHAFSLLGVAPRSQ